MTATCSCARIRSHLHAACQGISSVLLAVSGGPDSMCMLHALSNPSEVSRAPERKGTSASSQAGVRLAVATADHSIRPESACENQLVQSYSARLGVPVERVDLSVKQQGQARMLEEARQQRYSGLAAAALRQNASAVLTAHQSGVDAAFRFHTHVMPLNCLPAVSATACPRCRQMNACCRR